MNATSTPAPKAHPPLPNFIRPELSPDTYAVTGIGTCMEPLIADGTVLVFSQTDAPERGDIVGLIFTEEAALRRRQPGMIKRLALALPPLNLTDGWSGLIVVEQVNPPRQFMIPTSEVLAVHKAIGTGVSQGNGFAAFNPTQLWAGGAQ